MKGGGRLRVGWGRTKNVRGIPGRTDPLKFWWPLVEEGASDGVWGKDTMTRRNGWLRIEWRAGTDKLGKVYRKVEVLVTDVAYSFWSWYLDSFFFQSQDECFKFDQCRAPWFNWKNFLFTNKPKKVDRDYWTQCLHYGWFIPESYIIQRVITISIIILSLCSSMAPMDILTTLLWNLCKVCNRDFPTLMYHTYIMLKIIYFKYSYSNIIFFVLLV